MKKKFEKRWLALLLSAAMTVTAVPVSAGEFTDGVIEGIEEVNAVESEMAPGAELFDAGEELTEEETPEFVFEDGTLDNKITDESDGAASAFLQSGDYTYYFNDYDPRSGVNIDKYTGTAFNVTVPETIEGHIVTKISVGAFEHNLYIKNVILPDSIVTIEKRAFHGCTSLESLKLPSKLQTLGEAFIAGTAIEHILVPKSLVKVDNSYSGTWRGAFDGANSLKTVAFEEGIQRIPYGLFDNYYEEENHVTEIKIPNTVTEISTHAFSGCRELKQIVLPESLNKIEDGAFYRCQSLEEIVIPKYVSEMKSNVFSGCQNIQRVYFEGPLPKGMGDYNYFFPPQSKINLYYPEGEPSWNEIPHDSHWAPDGEIIWKTWNPPSSPKPDEPDEPEIPSDDPDFKYVILSGEVRVTEYTGNAAEVNVPEQLGGKPVADISRGAFNKETDNVKSINLPSTVKTLDPDFCIDCGGLEKITVSPENPYLCAENNVIYNKEKTKVITVLRNKESVVLPDGLTEIGERAFKGCENLLTVIPNPIHGIRELAFAESSNQAEIVIPESVKHIGKEAFAECINVKKITFCGTLESMGDKAFYHCGKSKDPSLNVYFKKNPPASFSDKVFVLSDSEGGGIAYFPENSGWTTQIMQKMGITLWRKYNPNDENHKIFTMENDSNRFTSTNGDMKMDGFNGIEKYAMDKSYYDLLLQGTNWVKQNEIKKEMDAEWTGLCYGLSATMGLLFENYISIETLTNDRDIQNYHKLQPPYLDTKLLNVINYYHFSQYLDKGGVLDASFTRTFGNKFLSGLTSVLRDGDSLSVFLEKLVNAASDNRAVLFSYMGAKNEGHAVLITGYTYNAQTDTYHLKICDSNHQGKFLEMAVNGKFSYFTFTDGNKNTITKDTYHAMYLIDWNRIVASPGRSKVRSMANQSEVVFRAGIPATVKASNGKSITYDGSRFSGDMPVYGINFVGEGTSTKISVKTDYCEAFTVSGSGSKIDVEISDMKNFMSLEGQNIGSAEFSVKDGISIAGQDYSFKAYVSSDTDDDLISVSAEAASDVDIIKKDGKIQVKAEKPLEKTETAILSGTDKKTETYDKPVSDITVNDKNKPDECVHKWSGWKIITEATVFAKGTELRRCLNCGQEERRETPKLSPTISVSKKKVTVKVKKSVQIKVTYAKGDEVASWKSSKKAVATVDSKGKITGKKAGEAIVTVKLKSGKSAKITVTVQDNKPSKPVISGIRNTASGVNISWKKSSGASKYYVYRSVNGGSYKKVKTLTGTSWTDTGAKGNGTKYQYKIYANNSSGNSSAAVTKAYYFLPRMQKPSVTKVSGAIVLGWNINKKSSGYQIQYATDSKFTNAETATANSNGYNRATLRGLTTGKTYYFRVRSYKTVAGKTSYSYWSAYSSVKL